MCSTQLLYKAGGKVRGAGKEKQIYNTPALVVSAQIIKLLCEIINGMLLLFKTHDCVLTVLADTDFMNTDNIVIYVCSVLKINIPDSSQL